MIVGHRYYLEPGVGEANGSSRFSSHLHGFETVTLFARIGKNGLQVTEANVGTSQNTRNMNEWVQWASSPYHTADSVPNSKGMISQHYVANGC
jgi:hypothetical protein